MGLLAAHSMLGRVEEFGMEMQFELFAHVTRFFGYKVCCSINQVLITW